MKHTLLVLLALSLVFIVGCEDAKDSASEALDQSFEYDYDTTGVQIGVNGFCAPVPGLEDIIEQNTPGEWETLEGHVKSVEVAKIQYRIPENNSDAGRVEILVGDLQTLPPADAELVAATKDLAAGETVADYARVNWIGEGRATLNGYVEETLEDDSLIWYLCGMFDPANASVEMTMDMVLTIKVTVTPLSD